MPNTIVLRGDNVTFREDRANAAITPGHLLDFASNDRLTPNATDGGRSRMFALEQPYTGGGVTTAYASGDRVAYADCAPGTIVWAHLASGQNVARGAALMGSQAFPGALIAHTGTNFQCAEADEDADASSGYGATETLRFRARVI